jgi:site-specific recombinase XerD
VETRTETVVFDQKKNQKIFQDYVQARKIETNISVATQENTSKTLAYLSRRAKNNFKNFTRNDIVSFLNILRKSESDDPSHK